MPNPSAWRNTAAPMKGPDDMAATRDDHGGDTQDADNNDDGAYYDDEAQKSER